MTYYSGGESVKTIQYRATYGGQHSPSELIQVQARDINSGFGKALKKAKEPLGSGRVREIAKLEFVKIQ